MPERLGMFARLVSSAIANATPEAEATLASEHGALRRVAELVARGAAPEQVFGAVAAEASVLLQGQATTLTRYDGVSELVVVATAGGPAPVGTRVAFEPATLPERVRRERRAVRVDDYRDERDAGLAERFGLRAAVAVPIAVEGRVWGMLTATSSVRPLPEGTEGRLEQFAQLVAAAMANSDARADLESLAHRQTALRRIAELTALEEPVDVVLEAVAVQASRLAGVEFGMVLRFESDGSTEIVALDGAPPSFQVGLRAPADGDGAVHRVWRTGRAARVDDLAAMSGRWPRMAVQYGFTTSAGVPIRLEGRLWGALVVVGRDAPMITAIETHVAEFAELVSAGISAANARAELRELADEQAALRRVAELVARGAVLDEVFSAVATEASRLLGDAAAALLRYDDERGAAVVVAACNSPAPVGLAIPAGPGTATGDVRRTGRPVRVEDFSGTALNELAEELRVRTGVAVAITVEGRVWGALTTSTSGSPLPDGAEERLSQLAELAAAAIANAENKAKLTASRARVIATADETRRRLQRDLHDGSQQRLVQALITLRLARDALARGRPAEGLIDEALHHAERANRELRDLVRGILPAALTRGGLRAGIESLVVEMPLEVDLHVEVPRLPAATETTAYFIVAEALTNVVKHASDARAHINVALRGDELSIDVRDDGPGGADPQRGTGLTGLIDRVEASSGVLTITSPPGEGTRLQVTLPAGEAPPSEE